MGNYARATITKKAERSVRDGHPWVYGEEITELAEPVENGGIAEVYSESGRLLGSGFYNSKSRIAVRLLTRGGGDECGEALFRARIRSALSYRRDVMGQDFGCCRLIFGEADGLPGLTVDRYGDVLVAQTLCLGMEKRKDTVFGLLLRELRGMGEDIRAIYERNEPHLRLKEGMEQYRGYYTGAGLSAPESTVAEICENGLYYTIDYGEGQKTGFFLDQKYNRLAAARLARGKKVLDCFTHTGAFGMNAALAGARHVTCVDISESALTLSRANAERNGLADIMDFKCADVFDLLTNLSGEDGYDYIILDPPAFTKSAASLRGAIRGYKEINLRAMKLLPDGGYLATCSCSHFMTDELFRKMLHDAARDAHVSLRQIESRRQSPDHPILWSVPETEYLKFYLLQIIRSGAC